MPNDWEVSIASAIGYTPANPGEWLVPVPDNVASALDQLVSRLDETVDTNLSIANRTPTTLDVASSNGTDATVPPVNATEAGLMIASDKNKLDGIEAGAQVNVQSDWNATSGDAFILNKPDIPTFADIWAINTLINC